VYSVDGSGNLTLVGSIVNDTSLFGTTSTSYSRSLSASFSKVAGQRYAVAVLQVGTTTATLHGASVGVTAEGAVAPRVTAQVSGQTDLPASIAVGSLQNSDRMVFAAVVP
jgi:hypothetical protein